MQTTKFIFVLALAMLVMCAAASEDEKEDNRPLCFRDPTEDEKNDKKKFWTDCKEECKKDKEGDKKTYWKNLIECVMKKKGLLNDAGELVMDAMEKHINNYVLKEHKEKVMELFNKCKDKTECKEFFTCIKENKKDLPCKCHKKWNKKGKGDNEEEKKKEEEAQAQGDLPT